MANLNKIWRVLLYLSLFFNLSAYGAIEMARENPPSLDESVANPVIQEIVDETEDFFMDPDGFLKILPADENGPQLDNENPVLFTSEYFYFLKSLGVLKGEFRQFYRQRVLEMMARLRLERGLFNRYPGQTPEAFRRHFSRDEQIGLITLDAVFEGELGFSQELYDYGINHHFRYENRTWSSPGVHQRTAYRENGEVLAGIELQFEGQRTPEFITTIKVSSGHSTTLVGKTAFCEALRLTQQRPYENTSGKIMAYLRFLSMSGKSGQMDRCIGKFREKMEEMYGGNPLAVMMEIYFKHPRHPLRKLASLLSHDT